MAKFSLSSRSVCVFPTSQPLTDQYRARANATIAAPRPPQKASPSVPSEALPVNPSTASSGPRAICSPRYLGPAKMKFRSLITRKTPRMRQKLRTYEKRRQLSTRYANQWAQPTSPVGYSRRFLPMISIDCEVWRTCGRQDHRRPRWTLTLFPRLAPVGARSESL